MYKLSELIIERTFANSFFAGGIYECTINDSRGRYNQSKLAFILIKPSSQSIENFDGIPLWIPPSGTRNIQFDQNNLPRREMLTDLD